MTQDKPLTALTARLRTNDQGTRTDALMARYGALWPLDKLSKDFDHVSWR
jgi:hypothetical protein